MDSVIAFPVRKHLTSFCCNLKSGQCAHDYQEESLSRSGFNHEDPFRVYENQHLRIGTSVIVQSRKSLFISSLLVASG